MAKNEWSYRFREKFTASRRWIARNRFVPMKTEIHLSVSKVRCSGNRNRWTVVGNSNFSTERTSRSTVLFFIAWKSNCRSCRLHFANWSLLFCFFFWGRRGLLDIEILLIIKWDTNGHSWLIVELDEKFRNFSIDHRRLILLAMILRWRNWLWILLILIEFLAIDFFFNLV